MQYTDTYSSPVGDILLAADDTGLTGLWFKGAKYFAATLDPVNERRTLPVFDNTRRWLDMYFSGREPDFTPELHMSGSPFRLAVWGLLLRIPYGSVVTYGELADEIAKRMGVKRMSAQAVGGAVGHNPVSIIVPCHRVVGTNGSLTGYAGGVDRKLWMLKLEKADTNRLTVLKK